MNRIAVIIVAVLLNGCYTQLQLANKETTSNPPYIYPEPIEPIYPSPIPHPCPPPRPSPPTHPIIIVQPAEQVVTLPAKGDRIRTDGSTRDERNRSEGGRGRR